MARKVWVIHELPLQNRIENLEAKYHYSVKPARNLLLLLNFLPDVLYNHNVK
ncbi:hypothetical protein [Sulfurihydrogenibium yellowstonense]|uniref:hypothetical protein n=1 Tax=Sulfurihydrogenibium yellowstonense TaxID=304736 RepID=UPI0012E9B3E8|nr:hypothetical protein [Sulfurihydrogenibium yellowstonense]